jgi:outer membrane lipoprotein-sorting protein
MLIRELTENTGVNADPFTFEVKTPSEFSKEEINSIISCR